MATSRRNQSPARKRMHRMRQAIGRGPLLEIEQSLSCLDDEDLAAMAAELRSLDEGNCAWRDYRARDFLLSIVRDEQRERARLRQRTADRLNL